MHVHAYKHARLMDESEADRLVANRILASPDAYRRWEIEHDHLLRAISEQAQLYRQVVMLRSAACALVHRKALFEYLRDCQVRGARRHRLFALFYGFRDYTNAVLAEHGNYVRCSSSYLCMNYLGEHLMRDAALDEPLQLYERWYAEYFRTFCDVALAETEEEKNEVALMETLKPLLKYRLAEARQAILQMPLVPAEEWRQMAIRKPTGDTQRVRALFSGSSPSHVARLA